MFTIAKNLVRKQWRRASRLQDLDGDAVDGSADPSSRAEVRDDLRRIHEVVRSLPEIDRVLFGLRTEQELSYADIAKITGLSIAAAKVRIFRLRLKLTQALDTDEEK